jgi:hypothetical protein
VLSDGWVRDHGGFALAFTKDAGSGPMKPTLHIQPVRPVRRLRPVRPVAPVAPVRGVRQSAWSPTPFDVWAREQ